jgi:hypothetical protein
MSSSRKKNTKPSRMASFKTKNKKELPQTKEHKNYLWKMAIFWVASTISGIIIFLIANLYADEIADTLSENKVISLSYLSCYLVWLIYRVGSRSKIKNHPEFQNKLKSDLAFAKRYNKTEVVKTVISYLFYSLPIFYASGMIKPFLEYFGYASDGFALDLKNVVFSIFASVSNLALALFGSYLYDKIKHKLP